MGVEQPKEYRTARYNEENGMVASVSDGEGWVGVVNLCVADQCVGENCRL